MSTHNSLHATAYRELIEANQHPKLIWWLVSNLAEVDETTERKLSHGVHHETELNDILFSFIGRASFSELDQFNSLWQSRQNEVTKWLN